MVMPHSRKKDARTLSVAVCLLAVVASVPASAADTTLFPQTKLRISVLQWSPAKGMYEDSPAFGGEFVISDTETLTLPLVGVVDVAKLDSRAIADGYGDRLQAQTGLLQKPEVTVSVLEYPPLYVSGDVTTPGEYKYRPGLTALQALAMSGGLERDEEKGPTDHIRLLFDLQAAKIDILRSQTRIERLDAEMADAETFDFPKPVGTAAQKATLAELYDRENIIFAARNNELRRQTATLNELRHLLNAEINVLDQKITSSDEAVKSTEKELAGIRELVKKGVTVVSRQTGLERLLSSLRADRLDQITSVMRAKQNIAEATRNIVGLQDQHRTEVATQLQTEHFNLEQAELKRDLTRNLLLKSLEDEASEAAETQATVVTRMTIVRNADGKTMTRSAADDTRLMPGDVLKVVREISQPLGGVPQSGDAHSQKLSRADP